jgi:FtsP/CotA-like multicopper oxidase with cupredoxin domain
LAFVQPTELTSVRGRLEVTLRAEATKVPFGDGYRYAVTYNGTAPGPTLRVRPGDTLVITLENRLGEATNLHTHGLHVSPSEGSDNVFVSVDSGKDHTYTYTIPDNHRSSLCWYHPHLHGAVAEQLGGGMFGALIVEDAIDSIAEIGASKERILMLHDPRIGDTDAVLRASNMEVMRGRTGDAVLVNGLLEPRIVGEAGTLERWRVLNASPSRYYRLTVAHHDLHVIGTDSGRLVQPVTAAEVLLAPGERSEFLIAPSRSGRFTVRSEAYDRGSVGMGGSMMGGSMMGNGSSEGEQVTLAVFEVTGSAPVAPLPSRLAEPSSLDISASSSERPFRFAMGMGTGNGMGGMGGMGQMMSFTINDAVFDASRTDVAIAGGVTEDWVITNSSTMDHPFHLHVWPFQVIERSAGPVDVPGWKDTVNVPAGSTVRIRVPFVDLVGRTVYHCHILDHEDQGMMGVIEVS